MSLYDEYRQVMGYDAEPAPNHSEPPNSSPARAYAAPYRRKLRRLEREVGECLSTALTNAELYQKQAKQAAIECRSGDSAKAHTEYLRHMGMATALGAVAAKMKEGEK